MLTLAFSSKHCCACVQPHRGTSVALDSSLLFSLYSTVKPNTPENVTLLVMKREDNLYLHVRWEPPYNTDTKSGWVTIKYELRVKQEKSNEWKVSPKQKAVHWFTGEVLNTVCFVKERTARAFKRYNLWSACNLLSLSNGLIGLFLQKPTRHSHVVIGLLQSWKDL